MEGTRTFYTKIIGGDISLINLQFIAYGRPPLKCQCQDDFMVVEDLLCDGHDAGCAHHDEDMKIISRIQILMSIVNHFIGERCGILKSPKVI